MFLRLILLFSFTWVYISGDYPDTFYEITLITGSGSFTGTDANIYLQLSSSKGTTKNVKLTTKYGQIKSGSTVTLNVDFNQDIGDDIDKIKIGHDNFGIGAAWYLEQVHIEHELTGKVNKFYIKKWLDDDASKNRHLYVVSQRRKDLKKDTSCGVTFKPRVVNGQTAMKGQWPWQTQIRIRNSYVRHHCGGTLIHPQYILTAAHCVDGIDNPKRFILILGEHILGRGEGTEQVFTGEEIIKHAGYNKITFENDIALIKLHQPAQLNSYVKTACLPNHGDKIKAGEKCYISGWGNIYGGGPTPAFLQQALLPTTSNKQCDTYMLPILPLKTGVKSTMLCAGGFGKGGCHGDSGGPLVCQNKTTGRFNVEGAVSWGSPTCSLRNTYTVFARISSFVDWILANIYTKYVV